VLWSLAPCVSAQAKSDTNAWTLKMRVYHVPGKGPSEPIGAVTSSYLSLKLTATIQTEYDMADEIKQIQKTFNYADIQLMTEADFAGTPSNPQRFHIFRIDGREYLVLIRPHGVFPHLSFGIDVDEQGETAKVNLLSTNFGIPEKNIAVFGFEDTKGGVYFLSFRLSGGKATETLIESKPFPEGGISGSVVGGVRGGIPEEGPVRAVGEIKPPRLIKQVDPVYPEIARQAQVEGIVILEAETDISGHVRNARILRSIPLLDQAAFDAVRQWVYEPIMIDGKPRGCIFTVTVGFTLDRGRPAPRKDGEPLKIPGNINGPKLLKQVDPIYPEAAKKAGVEGAVILEPTTDIYGRVRDIKVLRSIPLLDQAAIDAVRQWVYEPPVVDGKPISVTFTVTVRFTLDNSAPSEKVTVVENRAFDGPFITSFMGWRRDDIKKRSPAETDAVWATGAIKPPKRIKTVDPVYPEPARKSGSEGDIILNVETDPAGKVRWVQVMGGPFEFLGYAAVDAVKQWEYEPLIVDGKPRAALFTVTVRFSLK